MFNHSIYIACLKITVVCPMGTFYTLVNSKTQCVVCPVGQYNDMRNQPQCTPCPSGNTTFDTGNVYIESCIGMLKLQLFNSNKQLNTNKHCIIIDNKL